MTTNVNSLAFGSVHDVRQFYQSDAIGIVVEKTFMKFYQEMLPVMFQKSFFLAKEQFFHPMTCWVFRTPNKDGPAQSFVNLINSGIYQLWIKVGIHYHKNRDAHFGFQKLFKDEAEGRFWSGEFEKELERLPLGDSLLKATFHVSVFGISLACLTFAREIICQRVVGRVKAFSLWTLRLVKIHFRLRDSRVSVIHVQPNQKAVLKGDFSS
jgi:hypothetical protein